MKIAAISFTEAGSRLCCKLVREFRETGDECTGYIQERYMKNFAQDPVSGLMPVDGTLAEWTREAFSGADGLIFIGACGIAVRAIAPFLKDKFTDPAVVSVDEDGRYAVPLLSGHAGGANELAGRVASACGGVPVISTATDVEGKFAVDVFATAQGLWISDRQLAKRVSAGLLDGNPVGFYSDFKLDGGVPEGFTQRLSCDLHVWITVRREPPEDSMIRLFLQEPAQILRLVPKALYIGIGCRRGTGQQQIRQAVEEVLAQQNLCREAVKAVASIDLKKDEPGLTSFAKDWGLEFLTFSAAELEAVDGEFCGSGFVKQVTGVDNVCERSAVAAAGCCAMLIVPKQVVSHVTVAVACRQMEYKI